MAPKPDKVLKLICKECGYENEAQRVYCHNCGTKLDRSIIPKAEEKTSGRTQRQTASRVKKAQGKAFSMRQQVFGPLWKVVVLSITVASLIEIARPPEGIPGRAEVTGDVPSIVFDLDAMLQAPTALKRVYTQAEVNNYLRSTVKAKGNALGGALEFGGVFVNFYEDNTCRFGLEQKVFDYSLYATTLYYPEERDGKMTAVNTGGYIGRLPIHPGIMKGLDFIFSQVWKSLSRELDKLSKMESIEVGKQNVTVISAPGRQVQ